MHPAAAFALFSFLFPCFSLLSACKKKKATQSPPAAVLSILRDENDATTKSHQQHSIWCRVCVYVIAVQFTPPPPSLTSSLMLIKKQPAETTLASLSMSCQMSNPLGPEAVAAAAHELDAMSVQLSVNFSLRLCLFTYTWKSTCSSRLSCISLSVLIEDQRHMWRPMWWWWVDFSTPFFPNFSGWDDNFRPKAFYLYVNGNRWAEQLEQLD